MSDILVCDPLRVNRLKKGVTTLLVWSPWLFVGETSGNIIQFRNLGQQEKTFVGHTAYIGCLLRSKEVLWSTSQDGSIRLWNIQNGECIKWINSTYIPQLVVWKEFVVCGQGIWNADGTLVLPARNIINDYSVGRGLFEVWNDLLCFCFVNDWEILVLESLQTAVFSLSGHSSPVEGLAAVREWLFSGSYDRTIRKWNQLGECVNIFQMDSAITDLVMFNGELFGADFSFEIKRWNLDGNLLGKYRGHSKRLTSIIMWRGALLSGCVGQLIQWTPFYLWNPSRHKEFSPTTREAMKAVIILAKHRPPLHLLPYDIVTIILQFYATE